MRDLLNNIDVRRAISPFNQGGGNAAIQSQIIDTRGYSSLTFIIATGNLADSDATFAVSLQHGNASDLSDATTVPADELVGTTAAAGFTFANDDSVRKIGYRGSRRYVRLVITPSNNDAAAQTFLSAVAILGHPQKVPTSNPPA